MNASPTPLPCPDSPLRRLDPRWKLAALTLAIVTAAALRGNGPAALALGLAIVHAVVGQLPRRWCLARLGTLFLVTLPFLLILPLQSARDTSALHAALLLLLKTATVGLLAMVLLTSSPLADTFKAARALGVPRLLVHLAMLTYRYAFLLAEELRRIRVALRVRGYRNRANLHGYRTVGHVAGVLLVRGHERAERVAQAMRCRGFDGTFHSLDAFRTRPTDLGFFALIALALVLILLWDRVFV